MTVKHARVTRLLSRSNASSALVAGGLLVALVLVHRSLSASYFFHDDWIHIAHARGVLPLDPVLARPMSFHLYWRFMDALFGIDPRAYLISRLLIHFATGLVLGRIAERLGACRPGAWLGVVLYLFSPLAFETLYWASGVVDLLAMLGLVVAVAGALERSRRGAVLLLVGGVVSLMSKEIAWWLPVAALAIWRHERHRNDWAAAGIMLTFVAVTGLLSTWIGLRGDYTWTLGALPWGVVRAGSWIASRPTDLALVWYADRSTIMISAGVWLSWLSYVTMRAKRGDRVPALLLLAGVLSLLPAVGLHGHFVPRYMMPLQGVLALTIARWPLFSKRAAAVVVSAGFVLFSSWCIGHVVDATYPSGRPLHRMVAKSRLASSIWAYIESFGVDASTGVAFLLRPEDDVEMRQSMLDVVGGIGGIKAVLGKDATVVITGAPGEIPMYVPTFQFGDWSLEYLGELRPKGSGSKQRNQETEEAGH